MRCFAIFPLPEEEMWVDAGQTCDTDGSNTHIDWENGLITVNVSVSIRLRIQLRFCCILVSRQSVKLYNIRSYVPVQTFK